MTPHSVDPKVQRIIRWRENLSTMQEDRFFEIMRIYIGEIHTPFNKDKLIEQLSSIFRKDQNKQRILSYLSTFDIKIITAICSFQNATKEKLIDFFKNEYPLSEIYSELLNLSERLIIYSYESETSQSIIELNPLLEDILKPLVNINQLLPSPVYFRREFDTPFVLTPQFIAAFLSYILENPELCKNNSSLKKKDSERLEEIFPGKANCLKLLLNSFLNLRIAIQSEKEILIDETRCKSLAQNPHLKQLAYLSTASVARLGREGLRSQSQLLLDLSASIPKDGLSKSSLIRLAYLISNKAKDESDSPVQSRFSRILASHMSASQPEFSETLIEQIIDSAIEFGFFSVSGYTEDGEKILIPCSNSFDFETIPKEAKKSAININAGTSITILPCLKLDELLSIVQFMNIINCSTVTEYEITRKSIARAFDKNMSPEQIFSQLEEYSAYSLPQNLIVNVQEWHNTYASALLYKGYILKVDEKSEKIVENNPKIKNLIQLKLAPGIYLLNLQINDDAENFIKNCGLEFMGNVKTAQKENEMVIFPPVAKGKNFLDSDNFEENEIASQTDSEFIDAQSFKEYLLQKLETIPMSSQQKECLSTRIQRGVILTEEQLRPETVRLEILEAEGMNFSGKLHLIENAIEKGDLIQFTIQNEVNTNNMLTFLVKPLMIAKQASDSLIKAQIQTSDPEEIGEIRFYSLSRINHVKIIRTSIFR